jgi:hypothetical protein
LPEVLIASPFRHLLFQAFEPWREGLHARDALWFLAVHSPGCGGTAAVYFGT